jgi:hypothetical protein
MAANRPYVLVRQGVHLVFGLEWFPLLGRHPEAQAASIAHRMRATSYVTTASGAASPGVLVERIRSARREPVCSAAAIVAGLRPAGSIALMLEIEDAGYWLVAVHEGAVMSRSDTLFDNPADIHAVVAQLRESHPMLEFQDLRDASAEFVISLFDSASDRTQLRNLSPFRRRRLRWVVGALALAAWGMHVSGIVSSDVRRITTTEPEIDPAGAWAQAIAEAVGAHSVHGVPGLFVLMEALHELPISIAGWVLRSVDCRAYGGEWRCQSRYLREGEADNQGFIDAALPAWALTFEPLGGVTAAWAVPMPVTALAAAGLGTSAQNEARLFSAFQAMLPAFTELSLDSPLPIAVRAPHDAHRQPIVRPSGLPIYLQRKIRVQAPLRSLSLLLPEVAHVSWAQVTLNLDGVDAPSLRSSSLRVSLSGVLYELDEASSVPHPLGVDESRRSRSDGNRARTAADDGARAHANRS